MKKWMLTTAALALAGCAQINSYQDAVQTPAPASLQGTWHPEHLLAWRQALDAFDF